VSVVLPTYNEVGNVTGIVEDCREALADHETELLVVDDDSPDGTWRVARDAYADAPDVRIVRRTGERGLASAVARGFREASNEVCAALDADFQHPPRRLPALVAPFADPAVDVVVGSRYAERGRIEGWSPARRLLSAAARLAVRATVPPARVVSDPTSGFFAVRRSVVATADLRPVGYKILLEVLSRSRYDRVVEVPYAFRGRQRGESKLTARECGRFVEHLPRGARAGRGRRRPA
jgi:dolichol-phosphate mannosyltransferase